MLTITVPYKGLTKTELLCPNDEEQSDQNESYCRWSQPCASLLTLFHTYPRVEEPLENIDDTEILSRTVKDLRWGGDQGFIRMIIDSLFSGRHLVCIGISGTL